jgi:hypothetical protein
MRRPGKQVKSPNIPVIAVASMSAVVVLPSASGHIQADQARGLIHSHGRRLSLASGITSGTSLLYSVTVAHPNPGYILTGA